MSLGDWDPRAPAVMFLRLVAVDSPDGPHRFILGADGRFVDVNGHIWLGSTLARVSETADALNGIAPEGRLEMSYFQDPDAPDLVAQLRALGLSYLDGRDVSFYLQPLRSHAELSAPVQAPVLRRTRRVVSLTTASEGPQRRTIRLAYEAATIDRRSRRAVMLNTEGHAKLTGSANPSLSLMPTTMEQDEKLFG